MRPPLYQVTVQTTRRASLYVVAKSSLEAEQIVLAPILSLVGTQDVELDSVAFENEAEIPPEVLEELAFSPDGAPLGIIRALQENGWQPLVEDLLEVPSDSDEPPVKLELHRVSLTLEKDGRRRAYGAYVAAKSLEHAQNILFNLPSLGSAIDRLENDPSLSLASLTVKMWVREAVPKRALGQTLYDTDGDALGTVGDWLKELG